MAGQVRPEVSEVIIKLLAMSVSSEALTGAEGSASKLTCVAVGSRPSFMGLPLSERFHGVAAGLPQNVPQD